jgi:ATP-dependent Lhr-like helicase
MPFNDFQQVREIRRGLGAVWGPFFGGFGRLTPVQLEAIPPVLAGRDVVVTAPSAAGKTEAVLAPLARRLLPGGGEPAEKEGPSLLYIIPTRALVADMKRRFSEVFKELDISCAFRTSDTPHLPDTFPLILFTTPESFDSLLCRKREVFANVETVVLDELHLLDNTYRGDQVRVLLNRLEKDGPRGKRLMRAILSATIPDPEAMAGRYGVRDAEFVGAGEPRGLEFHIVESLGEAIELARKNRRFKTITFCNSRRECEELSRQVVENRLWPADAVFVHHASLSAAKRKQVETSLKESTHILCFATTTLELGIDIGDLSSVFLYRPPLAPSSFAQRLGRACRREETIFAAAIATQPEDIDVFRSLEELFRMAFLEEILYAPDYSVAVQQTFSILFASPAGVPYDQLFSYVEPICPRDIFGEIINHLVAKDFIRMRGKIVLAAENVMDMGEKGKIHANIPQERSSQVYDTASGMVLGEVSGWSASPGDSIVVGGRIWKVAGSERGKLYVELSGQKSVTTGRFPRRQAVGKFFPYLPRSVQGKMRNAT